MNYKYSITIKRVIDGDTVIVTVDLGFKTYVEKIIRLVNINAPEMKSKDQEIKAAAIASTEYLTTILKKFKVFTLESHKLDKYGRSIGTITSPDGSSIGQQMVDSGMAVKSVTKQ